jgi:hypothetical protein
VTSAGVIDPAYANELLNGKLGEFFSKLKEPPREEAAYTREEAAYIVAADKLTSQKVLIFLTMSKARVEEKAAKAKITVSKKTDDIWVVGDTTIHFANGKISSFEKTIER